MELLFNAYAELDLVAQWMDTQVLKLESRKHGSYLFVTTAAQGKVVFRASGMARISASAGGLVVGTAA